MHRILPMDRWNHTLGWMQPYPQEQQEPSASAVLSRRGLGAAALAGAVTGAVVLGTPEPAAAVMGMTAGRVPGRALHSSTSHLNLSRVWSLKPHRASTSQLHLRRFCQ